jgi:hypothetical protein
MRKAFWAGSLPLFALMVCANIASAASIYVVDSGLGLSSAPTMVDNAKTQLTSLGYAVSDGGPLASYSAFDQVWDLRYNAAISTAEAAVYSNYLAAGGRMYLSGERIAFADRDTSLVNLVSTIGGGNLVLTSTDFGFGTESITPAGQVVNQPVAFNQVKFNSAGTVSSTGSGFLVTQIPNRPGVGSLIGWDFGSLAKEPNARLLVGFDIEIFSNCQAWTQDMAAFLGAIAPQTQLAPVPVPLPLAAQTGLALLAALATRRLSRCFCSDSAE